MKHSSKVAAAIGKWLISVLAMISVLALPAIGYSQSSPPPPGPGSGGGGNPDTPLGGVPFDTNMTMVFFALAIVFAVVVVKKYQKRQLALLQQL